MTSDQSARDAEFEAEMAELRAHFIAGLARRHAALAVAWASCRNGDGEPAWLALREVAHKLSGAAACYGFDALGAAAQALDKRLSSYVPCHDVAVVAPEVDALAAEFSRALASRV